MSIQHELTVHSLERIKNERLIEKQGRISDHKVPLPIQPNQQGRQKTYTIFRLTRKHYGTPFGTKSTGKW